MIIGPEPPTDQSVWTFSYGCAVLYAIEEAEMWLEFNSTGGQAVANDSNWSYDNETCLSNSTYLGGKVQDFRNRSLPQRSDWCRVETLGSWKQVGTQTLLCEPRSEN